MLCHLLPEHMEMVKTRKPLVKRKFVEVSSTLSEACSSMCSSSNSNTSIKSSQIKEELKQKLIGQRSQNNWYK